MNVFVTGGTGFIGSHLCAKLKLQPKTNKVVTLFRDIHPSPWGDWLKEALSGCILVQGDILDVKLIHRVLADYHVEQVYHLAAQAVVSTAQKDPLGTFETNVIGTVNMLEACRQVNSDSHILVMSTDKVYGDNRMGVSEADPLGMTIGIYEQSKVSQDAVARAYLDSYGLQIRIARPPNAYGYDLSSRIIPNTLRNCLKGDPPPIYEGQEKTMRQYIYVEDLVSALILLLNKAAVGVWNIGTDDILTQEQVVRTICKYFPVSPKLVKRTKTVLEIQKQSVNWNKIKQLGWKPAYSFEEGIKETIRRFATYGY